MDTHAISEQLEGYYGEFQWNHDGRLLAVIEESGKIRIFDVENGNEWTIGENIETQRYAVIRFHPTRNLLVYSDFDNTVEVWNVDTGTLQYALAIENERLEIEQLTDDVLVGADEDDYFYLWNDITGELLQVFHVQEDAMLLHTEISPNSRLFLVRNLYLDLKLWVWRLDD